MWPLLACAIKRGGDQEVSVSGKMRQSEDVPLQGLIHQGVRLMYKVLSLTTISEPVGKS